jgi:hypothetical protein
MNMENQQQLPTILYKPIWIPLRRIFPPRDEFECHETNLNATRRIWIPRAGLNAILSTSVDSKCIYACQCLKCVKQAWRINTVHHNFTIKYYYSIKRPKKSFTIATVVTVASQNPSWKWSLRKRGCKFVSLILLIIRLFSSQKCCTKNQLYDYIFYGTFLTLIAQISKQLE